MFRSDAAPSSILRSKFAQDPDLGPLVDEFTREMPERITAILACWSSKNWSELGRIAHQLKGSAGGYGFDAISESAARLESTLGAEISVAHPAMIDERVEEFVELLGRTIPLGA